MSEQISNFNVDGEETRNIVRRCRDLAGFLARLHAACGALTLENLASGRGLPFSRVCRPLIVAVLFAVSPFWSALAQSYSVDWHTIGGGGGTSTNALYSLSGSAGLPDASSPMTNGVYSIVGGFWALPVAVQTTNAPALAIASPAPGFALISWTPPTPGFVLQETASLSPPNWVNAPSGVTNPITVPAGLPAKFYRLFRP